MPPGGADLLFDQVVVVEEPLGGRRDPPAALHRVGDDLVRVAQHALVGPQPRQQPVRLRAPCPGRPHVVPAGQRLGVLLELADAEQLGPQRLFVRQRRRSPPLPGPAPGSAAQKVIEGPKGRTYRLKALNKHFPAS